MLQVIEEHAPRAIVMCFGAEAADYRVELPRLPRRPPADARRARLQWAKAPALFEAFGWTVLDHDEFEADDLLRSLALAEERAGGQALLFTGDRDMFQCATEDVHVLMQPARKGLDGDGPEEVRERYGIPPEQVPDFIALRGDPSDGLPGAKGIGAKTAADMLRARALEHAILGASASGRRCGARCSSRRTSCALQGDRDAVEVELDTVGTARTGRAARRPRASGG